MGLAVGAGREQLAAIAAAQAQGFRVLALDGDPEAPGLHLADRAEVVDLRDADTVTRVARLHGVGFTLPVPIGRLLTTQAAVHEAMGLRGVRMACAEVCTDKQRFHEAMSAAGVTVPWQRELPSVQHLRAIEPASFAFPLILKPRYGSGSRGVLVVAGAYEWHDAVAQVLDEAPAEGWVLQSLVDGVALGVDGAVVRGRARIVLVREKLMSPWPHRVELVYRAPADIPDVATVRLEELLGRALTAVQANDCLFHADVILGPDGQPVLVELSARPSGLRIAAELVPACTGVDLLGQGLRLHQHGHADFAPRRAWPTVLHYWHHAGGIVQQAPDAAALRQLPNVNGAEVGWMPGQTVCGPASVAELLPAGHLLVSAPTWNEVESTLCRALSLFEVKPNEGT